MKIYINFVILPLAVLAAIINFAIQAGTLSATSEDYFTRYVDPNGNIRRPENFREEWTHIGTWYVEASDMSNSKSLHDVYVTPESVTAFKQEGQWPDGTIIVKTVSTVQEDVLTTGNAKRADDIDVWFVMVRDRHNRFPRNEAWGEGWGWALFSADNPDKNLTKTWKGSGFNNCFGCHIPARETEWVYIDGYPTVRDSADYTAP